MERGYLIAALALVITFAAMSHGARSVVEASRACHHAIWFVHPGATPSAAPERARVMKSTIRANVPDEAVLMAELNLPQIQHQTERAQQMARQQQEVAQRMTEQMTRNSMELSERINSDLARNSEDMTRQADQMTRHADEMSRNAEAMTRNMTERMVRQNMEIARCAQARALQQVERALKNAQLGSCADCQ
jgi:hypothetical protein